MPTPILAAKLYIPQPRPKAVNRHRLIERLNEGLHRKLTLLSAPAGFGKTTLVSEWLAALQERRVERPVAWLSLDEADSDPTRFLAYLVAALRTIAPGFGSEAMAAERGSQPPLTEATLTALLNEIASLPAPFLLVLDDYHVIDALAIDQALSFLLEHLPPVMHLVITTREDPPFPLARYRARGQLTEVRAADLRFTEAEAADFLNQVMGLTLSAQQIATLESHTEGWIAGLQLAALSMQGRHDVSGFIRAFAGDHRYIVDYLVEEVLQRQPEALRTFLLQTSILEQLSDPLCDAVTGQQESKTRLDALERGNFFVVPLDEKRRWYRYHHLFADVLQARLMEEQPAQIPLLHGRASEWYEQQALPAAAIRHALAAKDFARAAALIEVVLPAMHRNREEATTLAWLKMLPRELFRNRPVLSVNYAGLLLTNGLLEGVEEHLRDAERWLKVADTSPETPISEMPTEEMPTEEMIVVDQEAFRRLPGALAVYRAGYALARGDLPDTVRHARRALDLVPEEEHLWYGATAAILGLASWTSGDLEAAHRSYAEGMAHLQKAGNISDVIGGTIALADIRITQGRLGEAMKTYERALQLAVAHGAPTMRGTADMYVGMSALHRERNQMQEAMLHLQRSRDQGDHTGFPQNPYRWRVALARLREAEGDLDSALDLLQEAERLYVSDMYPNVRPVAALKARVWLAQERLADALGWVQQQGLSPHDDLSYLREFEHITLARVLLAQYTSERGDRTWLEATTLLQRLREAAEAGGRTGPLIEILLLLALAHQMQGDVPATLLPLERALSLAQPEGYLRIFVDEGLPMAHLLVEAAKGGIAPEYVRRLLAAFGMAEESTPLKEAQNGTQSAGAIAPLAQSRIDPLVEPLSERELEVLRLLDSDLNGPEIARKLMVSLNTMHTHTKNIYSKLGVNNRRAAVRRAEELHLL